MNGGSQIIFQARHWLAIPTAWRCLYLAQSPKYEIHNQMPRGNAPRFSFSADARDSLKRH
jgi:hypothetical protein